MTDLRPDTRAFLARVRDADDPSPADVARIRARVAFRLGAGAAAIGVASGVSAKASAAASGASGGAAIASGAGAGAAAVTSGAGAFATKIALAVALSAGVAVAVDHEVRSTAPPAALLASPLPSRSPPRAVASAPLAPSGPSLEQRASAEFDAAAPAPSSEAGMATSSPAAPHAAAMSPPASQLAPPTPSNPAPSHALAAPSSVTPARPGAEDGLAMEAMLLRDAQRALADGNAGLALVRLDAHAQRFPAGALEEDRAAMRVHVLCMLGRVTEARVAAGTFLATHRGSAHAPRVANACVDAAADGRSPGAHAGPPREK